MIRRINDYSYINDEEFEKIASVINESKKLVKITDDIDHAHVIANELQNKYDAQIEQVKNNYYIYAKPKQKVLLNEAKSSGFFKKIAYNQYQFNKQANNPLGWQHYDFDDGTIWKVMTAKDGKEYLVKEVNDKTNEVIRQVYDTVKNNSLIITANNKAIGKIKQLCNIIYGDVNIEFINDLMQASVDLLQILNHKLDLIIKSELDYLNIQSTQYKKDTYNKIMQGIISNKINNREQISNIIKGGNTVE